MLGFYLAVMAVLAGVFVLSQRPPIRRADPSEIPTINPSTLPTTPPASLPRWVTPHEVTERPLMSPTGPCTLTIPRSVTKVNGRGRYASLGPGAVICLPAGQRGNIKFFNLHGTAANPIIIRNEGGVVRIVGSTNKLGGIGLLRSSAVRITGTGVSETVVPSIGPDAQHCGIVIANALNGIRVLPDGSPRRIEIDHIRSQRTSTTEPFDRPSRSIPTRVRPSPASMFTTTISSTSIREGMYIGSEPHANRFETLGKLADVDISYNLVQRTGYDGIKVKVAVANVQHPRQPW